MRIPFLQRRVQQTAVAGPAPVAEIIPTTPPEPIAQSGLDQERAEWLKLAAMQRRTYSALRAEIEGTTAFVEQNVVRMADDFTKLGAAAGEQTRCVERIIQAAEMSRPRKRRCRCPR